MVSVGWLVHTSVEVLRLRRLTHRGAFLGATPVWLMVQSNVRVDVYSSSDASSEEV